MSGTSIIAQIFTPLSIGSISSFACTLERFSIQWSNVDLSESMSRTYERAMQTRSRTKLKVMGFSFYFVSTQYILGSNLGLCGSPTQTHSHSVWRGNQLHVIQTVLLFTKICYFPT